MSRCRHFDDEPVSADATPAPAIIAADIPAVTTPTPNHPKSRSTHAVFCPRSGRTVTRRISPGGRLRQLTLVLGSQDRLATGRVVARTRSRGGQTEGDASAVGVRQIGLCSGQVAMGRPWRRRYRDDRWPRATRCRRRGMCRCRSSPFWRVTAWVAVLRQGARRGLEAAGQMEGATVSGATLAS